MFLLVPAYPGCPGSKAVKLSLLLLLLLLLMAAKELKAPVDLGTSLGYTGEDLKQWLNDERMRVERES